MNDKYFVSYDYKGTYRYQYFTGEVGGLAFDNKIETSNIYFQDLSTGELVKTINVRELISESYPDLIITSAHFAFNIIEGNESIFLKISPKVKRGADVNNPENNPEFEVKIDLSTMEITELNKNTKRYYNSYYIPFFTKTNIMEINNFQGIDIYNYLYPEESKESNKSIIRIPGDKLPKENKLLYDSFPGLKENDNLLESEVYIYIDYKEDPELILSYLLEDGQSLNYEGAEILGGSGTYFNNLEGFYEVFK